MMTPELVRDVLRAIFAVPEDQAPPPEIDDDELEDIDDVIDDDDELPEVLE